MKNYKNDLVSRVIYLYDIYEGYMWKHDNVKLNILIQDNSIAFYLYDDKEELDNIVLSFSGKENNLYKYVGIRILLRIMDDVIVHRNDNEFHNRVLKSYLKIIVNDDSLLNVMKKLVDRQLLGIINNDSILVREIYDSVSNPLFYPVGVIKKLDQRISMTKKLLKNGVVVW